MLSIIQVGSSLVAIHHSLRFGTGKGRVGDWLQQQPSDTSDQGMTWSMITTGPYMDMLNVRQTTACESLYIHVNFTFTRRTRAAP